MSISGAMISTISDFRNPTFNVRQSEMQDDKGRPVMFNSRNPLKVMVAEVGYILMIPLAVVEAALSLIAKVFSYPLPISEEK